MKFRLFLCLLLVGALTSYAQRLPVTTYRLVRGDTIAYTRKINHYFGIQANQLLNQLINLSNNSTIVSNPYLIIYSFNSSVTGWGLNTGFNYSSNNLDNSDPSTKRISNIENIAFRVGFEKKSFYGKKWMLSLGLDVIWNRNQDDTKTSFQTQFNSNSTDTNSSTTYIGWGPRWALNFFVTERLILGTEATYYYKAVSNSRKITNESSTTFFDPNTGLPITTFQSSHNGTSQRTSDFSLTVPVVIFLIFKI